MSLAWNKTGKKGKPEVSPGKGSARDEKGGLDTGSIFFKGRKGRGKKHRSSLSMKDGRGSRGKGIANVAHEEKEQESGRFKKLRNRDRKKRRK